MEGNHEEVDRDIPDPGGAGNHRGRNCCAEMLLGEAS
jgi:hypothetical protein